MLDSSIGDGALSPKKTSKLPAAGKKLCDSLRHLLGCANGVIAAGLTQLAKETEEAEVALGSLLTALSELAARYDLRSENILSPWVEASLLCSNGACSAPASAELGEPCCCVLQQVSITAFAYTGKQSHAHATNYVIYAVVHERCAK